MDRILRLLIVVVASAAVALVIVGIGDRILKGVARRRGADPRGSTEHPVLGLVRKCRAPLAITVFVALLLSASVTVKSALGGAYATAAHLAVLVLIASLAWLLSRTVILLTTASFNRFAATASDRARVRRARTRLGMLRRVAVALIAVIAISSMLLTFPGVRAVGASLLASAGLIGIVAGVAAQSSLANLFAGLQIAFSDQVRIGDVVVVDGQYPTGQYGTVEEITLSYIVIATWDERRVVMPVSYFATKPYENWTRNTPRMTGTVFFQLDHRTPVEKLREELRRLLDSTDLWDGRSWSLLVTDTTPSAIQVRALLSAKDADDLFLLRALVREKLVDYLVREHPEALPRVATGPAEDGARPGGAAALPEPKKADDSMNSADGSGRADEGVRLGRRDRERG
ncbi:hypothetical protein BIV57_06160 [Mangrovactinospora gilvigrisea]|uniref:Mechanosensitive ion channel MscS domain-containing protein n=1 Tax=Mangrovactinospora gilvigrisea TaxID=1428644 RepID=A0A1J7BIF7_9ACTN|nr:mechanosensitive ion channel family protein [Mangrovactinospora gilvigrisea]OIV38373.1 hypothetical protein BIV57_06160 [Mangrovactinospora gilvigrisea]